MDFRDGMSKGCLQWLHTEILMSMGFQLGVTCVYQGACSGDGCRYSFDVGGN